MSLKNSAAVLESAIRIIRLSKKADSDKYKLKPKNKWNALSEGNDPTDE